MTIIGIDPGKNGGIAWITDGKPCVEKMPDSKGENMILYCRHKPDDHAPKDFLRKKEGCHAQEGGHSHLRKEKGFPIHCYEHRNQCDELPLPQKEADQSFSPSLPCAHKPFLFARSDGPASKSSRLFCHLIFVFQLRFSKRDAFRRTLIESSTFCYMWISRLLLRFGKLAKEPVSRIHSRQCISSRIVGLWVSPWLPSFHKKGHLVFDKEFFRYAEMLRMGCPV